MSKNYVIIDFETTGLSPLKDEVVEIGALKFENGKKTDSFEALLKPTVKVHPKALEAHGLTDAFLKKNGEDPESQWTKLGKFIGSADLIAHNGVAFDFQFLFNALSRHNVPVKKNKLIDTLPLSRRNLKTPSGKYKLEHLCEAFSIGNEKAHRAMGDVTALSKIFTHIEKHTPKLEDMWNLSGAYELGALAELPKGFELMQGAIEEGLDIQIDYEGKDNPRRTRWIRPLGVLFSRGYRYVCGLCLEPAEKRKADDDGNRQFRTDRFFGVLKTRKRE